jgi:choline monooxygenase
MSERFDPRLPIERASTPPSAWYTDSSFHRRERQAVFRNAWQPVGRLEQLRSVGDYISGDLFGEPFVVIHDGERPRAFFNVCRHHASHLVEGRGRIERFVCPYHGWSYDLDGSLRKAPRLGGVEQFDRKSHGLIPMDVDSWESLVFVRVGRSGPSLSTTLEPLAGRVDCSSLRFVKRVEYEIACNWKVFVDNYLDGGYHVEFLHRGLAGQLDLDSYRTEICGRISLQLCTAGSTSADAGGLDFKQRIGAGAVYAFIYPNVMINRYGPVMDLNWVLPLGPHRTLTVFDYFFERECDTEFIERSIAASDQVQQEDIGICEAVQRGLQSSGFDRGPYAPGVEQAAYHFHGLLAGDVK